MMTVPVRGLSKFGVITDADPYSLPPQAFSMGVNVRFHAGSILRSPVFRNALALSTASPRFCAANTPTGALSSVIVGYLNGTVGSISNGAETDVSITGYATNDAESNFTTCHLGNVFYVNRADRVPWSLKTTDSIFQTLANWTSTWRAEILRAAGGALCAFNITKAGVSYPTMVKTSDFAVVDTVPSTWDETDPTNNATENVLAEMRSPIKEAQALGENMVVYGLEETWAMVADGSQEVWSYHKLFDDAGAINANCAVEVNKQHFVFGLNDLWTHDGVSKKSIADQRVRNFVFSSLDINKASRCFVAYNAKKKEVAFNFVSGDAYTGFAPVDGCNRSAVYNISEDTWTFDDLPYVFGACEASVDTVQTWASTGATWSTVGGSWQEQEASLKRALVMVGDTNAAAGLSKSLYVFDDQGPLSIVALAVDTNATKGWALYRNGIDLDELGADLTGYKLLSSIVPQARLEDGAQPITFTIGAADYFNQAVDTSDPQTYDGMSLYRLDFNKTGRYLFMTITHDDWHYVNIAGFDFDLDVLGER